MTRRHAFLISYGRSGSTLLMALLSNHPRVLIRGENYMLMRYLQAAYNGLRAKHQVLAEKTSNSFYGAHLFQDPFLLPLFRDFVERFLAGDRNLEDVDVLGFKEIYYDDQRLIPDDLGFLKALFPDCLLIFNTRNPEQVARSEFNAAHSAETFAKLNDLYAALAAEHGGVVVDYADVVEFGPQTQGMLERLAIKADPEIVKATLTKQQGYVQIKDSARVSRVPYYVQVQPNEDVSFVDIQSCVRFNNGVFVISGGLVGSRKPTMADWKSSDPRARVVNFRGEVPTPHYAKSMPEPQYAACGFSLEAHAGPSDQMLISLFGKPFLDIRHISAMPGPKK